MTYTIAHKLMEFEPPTQARVFEDDMEFPYLKSFHAPLPPDILYDILWFITHIVQII